MDLELEDKVVVVTGGAKGIGAAIVRSFAAEGAIPVILGRSPAEGSALAAEIEAADGRAMFLEAELTDEPALTAALDSVRARFGRIDGVVNNAGRNDGVGLGDGTAAFVASLERNLVQCFAVVHHCLGDLKAARGFVINIGSKVATTGQGHTSGYAASKGGLEGLTREWALDLAADGIRVNAVIPAEVMTPLYESWLATLDDPEGTRRAIEARIPLGGRMTKAEEIADLVVFLASPRSGHTTGQIVFADGGYTHLDRAYGNVRVE